MSAGPIVIVEDQIEIREFIEMVLTDEGYPVASFEHGGAALLFIQQVRPRLLLLDLMMPIMNGWQVLQVLPNIPHTRTMPVVVMSAAYEARQSVSGSNVVMLEKPFDLNDLLSTIERLAGPANYTGAMVQN